LALFGLHCDTTQENTYHRSHCDETSGPVYADYWGDRVKNNAISVQCSMSGETIKAFLIKYEKGWRKLRGKFTSSGRYYEVRCAPTKWQVMLAYWWSRNRKLLCKWRIASSGMLHCVAL
jgi:hypothetical protein